MSILLPTPTLPPSTTFENHTGEVIVATNSDNYNAPYQRRLSDINGGQNYAFGRNGNIRWNGNFNYDKKNPQNNSETYYTRKGVKVGLIDEGFNNQKYYNALLNEVKNIIRVPNNRDTIGNVDHGYMVTSLIAGKMGIAKDAQVYVIDDTHPENPEDPLVTADFYQALYNQDVRIFNNSFGIPYETYPDEPDFYKEVLNPERVDFYKMAVENGSLFVFTAGNEYYRTSGINPTLPCWLPELEKGWINANELMYKGNKTEFSEFRELKPFVGAASAKNWTITTIVDYFMTVDGISDVVSGTSFAAPRVTATAALIKQKCPFIVRDF